MFHKQFQNAVDYVMSDVYSKIEDIAQHVRGFYIRLVTTPLPFRIIQVKYRDSQGNVIDVTKQYLSSRSWSSTISEDEVIFVKWAFNDDEYMYSYKLNAPIEFPPYTIEQLRERKPINKILAASADKNAGVCDLITKYAGPKHNFYIDKAQNPMDLLWIIESATTDSKVELIDSKGVFHTLPSTKLVFNET